MDFDDIESWVEGPIGNFYDGIKKDSSAGRA
jgi:hypothetical protein